MKYYLLMLVVVNLVACNPLKKVKKETPASGNPVIEGWYADPEGAILDNRYWIFPTFSTKFKDQLFFDAFSSNDMVNWTKHKQIIDTSIVKWVHSALWAPSVIEKDGKYYLFFSGNDIKDKNHPHFKPEMGEKNKQGGIGVCVADNPQGPYTDLLGKPLIEEIYNGAQPIDQDVFKGLDGNYYLVYGGWGHCNITRISDDFKSLLPFEDGDLVKEITPDEYKEGPTFFIRNNKYYFMWSEGGWTGPDYKVAYAIADSPLGPFERLETILEQDPEIATGAGHHSVLNIPGTDDWYIVYHRRPIPNLGTNHRVVCIDRMYFNKDGTIKPVQMTFEGVNKRKL